MKQRSIGLDLLRIGAAALVILCHSGFFSLGFSSGLLSFSGVLAVEIFFALSGFLVGRTLISAALSPLPGKALISFYQNRLFRILPLYYLALAATGLLSRTAVPLSNLVFLQNFFPEDLNFMGASWSLSVEMWFYFLMGGLLVLLTGILSRKIAREKALAAATGILILIPLALRILAAAGEPEDWDLEIRKQILLRLDAPMLGVLLALIQKYRPGLYRKLRGFPALAVSLGGIGLIYWLYRRNLDVTGTFRATAPGLVLLFTVLPLLCCLLVAALEKPRLLDRYCPAWAARGIGSLSQVTYAVYLLQVMVFAQISPYFAGARFSVSWLGFLLSCALVLLVSYGAYFLVEKPLVIWHQRRRKRP